MQLDTHIFFFDWSELLQESVAVMRKAEWLCVFKLVQAMRGFAESIQAFLHFLGDLSQAHTPLYSTMSFCRWLDISFSV